MNLIKVWIPYWDWEDWHAGMWRKVDNEEFWLTVAVQFTSNTTDYGNAMTCVIHEWDQTMLNRMTDHGINKRAFLGHCAACWCLGIPEYITRKAWKLLTQQQRVDADAIAQKTIDKWKKEYKPGLKNGKKDAIHWESQMHLQWI